MTVDVREDRIVARLVGLRSRPLVTSDQVANLFLDAVCAALEQTEPSADPPAPPAAEASPPAVPAPTREEQDPLPADLAAAYPEALRRLDAGEDPVTIARALRITPRQVRQWDEEPWVAPGKASGG